MGIRLMGKIAVLFGVCLVLAGLASRWALYDGARILPVGPMAEHDLFEIEPAFDINVFWPPEDDDIAVAVTAVAIGPDGSVYALHRADREFNGDATPITEPVIVRLDADTGEVIDRIGAGLFAGPHGLSVAQDGTLWVADTSLNMIAHLDENGRLIRRYGDLYPPYLEALLRLRNVFPRLPVPMSETTFARPTDVVPLQGGRFAVADGYRNSRLAVFEPSGELVWQINRRGSEPGAFHLPHGISVDREDRIYVADRRNARVQVFSTEGEVLQVIGGGATGRPFGIEVGADDCLYIADGGDGLDVDDETVVSVLRAGFSVLTADGTPVMRGGETGDGPDNVLLPHDIAVGPNGRIYIADLYAGRVLAIDLSAPCEGQAG